MQSSRPPGPRGMVLLGNTLQFGRDELGFLTQTQRMFGDLVSYDFAGWPSLLVNSSDDIEQILVKDHRNFIKNRIVWRHVTALFGQGLLTAEGDLWQRNRRLAAPAFAGQQLQGYGPDIVALANETVRAWRAGDIRDVHSDMMALTLRIAAKAFMDCEVERDIADMDHAVQDLVVEMAARFKRPVKIPDWVPLPGHFRYRRAIATVERIIAQMIAKRRADGYQGRQDFLSRLMAAKDESEERLSDSQLRDETVTLLLAGHETTALTLSWSLYLLGQNPAAARRLTAEVGETLGTNDATVESLPRLKFAESVILESMRLYPPAWAIGRESIGPFKLGGYDFAAATTVLISPWVLHRDPRNFDDPETFRPERWMDGLARRLPRFAYMPFGGGPRICIGQRFAMIEAVLILATIFRHFSVEWQRERPITLFPSITLRPREGVWVRLLPKTSASLH
ncbi:cytochrome P450 [Mesorhizobium sp. CN2-181]|uniref:cytochrome P450 n=1 Tax=Mesorhizobium yinganensis TaxID=3157707 RepID=UPI0032B7E7B4